MKEIFDFTDNYRKNIYDWTKVKDQSFYFYKYNNKTCLSVSFERINKMITVMSIYL